jgi:conjugative relaxase-like TrwC/TraI family protein
MLSIQLIKLGHEAYYLDLLDYYLNQGKTPTWIGGLAEVMQLGGQPLEREEFKRLLRGQHPWRNLAESGDNKSPLPAPLVQNAALPERQAAWDHTFSAPKSVSVVWSSATPEVAQKIEELQQLAVQRTMAFAEQKFAFSRVGKRGKEIVPAKTIVASILDYLSRAGDPQLHNHDLLFNLGYCQDGKYRSIISRPFFKNKMLLGALFRAHEAHLLFQELGFQSERVGNSFEIKGVAKDIIEFRSTRRKQILAQMAETGTTGAVAAAKAALATRSLKHLLPPLSVLKKQWPEEHERLFGFNAQTIEALRTGVGDTKQFIPEVLARASENIVANQHHFTAHEFLREALYEAPAYAVSPDDLIPVIQSYLADSADIVPIPALYGEQRYTTAAVLEQELGVLSYVRAMYETEGAVLSDEIVDAAIAAAQQDAQAKGYSISDEQIAAVRYLTQDKHAIRILQGYAGVGKTTATLRPTVKAFEAAGYQVIGAAYTATAAQQLAGATGIQCNTLHSLLKDYETDYLHITKQFAKHTIRQLGRAARRKSTWKHRGPPKPIRFDEKTVVLVDEAGMVGCRQTQMLLGRLQEAGATLLFTGDYAQLGAIEGTSPMFSLTQRIPHATITDIKRQEDEWAREAATHFALGNVAAALKLYDERNLLRSADDEETAMQALLDQWKHHSLHNPENSRILTCTNEQAHVLNLRAQQARLEQAPASGIRSPKRSLPIEDTDEGVTFASQVYVGDRVLFKHNAKRRGIWNGDAGTVVGFDGGRIVVDLDRGPNVSVPVMGKNAYKRVRLGYASTTNAAQGATFPIVFTLLTGSMLNRPIGYVQGTRSTKATHFFTTKEYYEYHKGLEESPLVSQLSNRPDLSLAVDFFVRPDAAHQDVIGRFKQGQ